MSLLLIFGAFMLAGYLFENLSEIIGGFLKFVEHVMGWASKMFQKFADVLERGRRKLFAVEVDASRIPPDIIPKEKLKNAKKVVLGVLTDREGTPLEVDTAFVPTQGMDREFRQQLDEGEGAIEFCV